MTKLRIGQKVFCVDDTPKPGKHWHPWNAGPTAGNIYTISDFSRAADGSPRLHVAELKCCLGYYPWRFRPIVERKTDISSLEALLMPGAKILEWQS